MALVPKHRIQAQRQRNFRELLLDKSFPEVLRLTLQHKNSIVVLKQIYGQ